MKRIFLFLLTNLAVLLVLSIVAQVTGLTAWLQAQGSGLAPLLVMAALFGFGGSLISLALSKWTAKRAMGVRVIEQPANADEQWLVNTVHTLASQAQIGMPEVGIFDSPEPNAFATGARRDHALVCVSSGLLRSMNQTQVQAVLGHEITHVANGDMITLSLLQGVVNTFVIVLARIVGGIVDRAISRDSRGGIGYFLCVMVAQVVFGVFASIIVMWFSRRREFRADAGGAHLAGRNAMISALEALRSAHSAALPKQMAAFGVAGGEGSGLQRLFMSHPPLEERIAALKAE